MVRGLNGTAHHFFHPPIVRQWRKVTTPHVPYRTPLLPRTEVHHVRRRACAAPTPNKRRARNDGETTYTYEVGTALMPASDVWTYALFNFIRNLLISARHATDLRPSGPSRRARRSLFRRSPFCLHAVVRRRERSRAVRLAAPSRRGRYCHICRRLLLVHGTALR